MSGSSQRGYTADPRCRPPPLRPEGRCSRDHSLADRVWSRIGTEFGTSWSLDRVDGFEKMESGINARPIDFAKLGRLYLNGGAWDGEQMVAAEWLEESTRPTGGGRPRH
jgi:CubicO group peptidase (beta-lactamase class C family)